MAHINKLFVIFKTHLDIGFTDFAANIKEKYIKTYIPKALETAKELREAGGKERFVWTTGSWLIYQYIKTLSDKELSEFKEQVIAGDVSWHALPFTSHTELMDAELFEAGLSISKELDELFGKNTIACKMTDVPGHTRAIVPFMAKAGVKFMHIGVNPASAVPVVPPIFRWSAPTGEEITVMYHSVYGSCSPLGDSGAAIYFAHAGDNLSPPSADDVRELFANLQKEYPDAEIIASDLNRVAEVLLSQTEIFPVITEEIGDSWIHGVSTDPGKVSMFRSLLRYRESITDKALRTEFNRRLLPIAEHTWGLDEKTHLSDHDNFIKEDFYRVRNNDNYIKMEQSWREQRAYIKDAISILPMSEKAKANSFISTYKRASVMAKADELKEVGTNTLFEIGDLLFSFDSDGSINFLKFKDKTYADDTHKICSWLYTQLGPEDYKRFYEQYIRCDEEWALEDFNKIGMSVAVEKRCDYTPKLVKVLRNGDTVTAIIKFPDDAHTKFGCPEWVETTVSSTEKGIFIDCAWFGKPANRCAEMLNIGFDTFSDSLKISKLGEFIDPVIIENGNHNLHASDFGVSYNEMDIRSLDAPLVSIGKPAILDFQNIVFNKNKVWFNLYNNQWGTNFPMWYEEDARFRFELIFN